MLPLKPADTSHHCTAGMTRPHLRAPYNAISLSSLSTQRLQMLSSALPLAPRGRSSLGRDVVGI